MSISVNTHVAFALTPITKITDWMIKRLVRWVNEKILYIKNENAL